MPLSRSPRELQECLPPEPTTIPGFLTHYFWERPFRSITALDAEQAAAVIRRLEEARRIPQRLTTPHYLPWRREIEHTMRRQFIKKGGAPDLPHPHYMVLGKSSIWNELAPHSISIPLSVFRSETISFTYSDSWVAYSQETILGEPIPPQPHRNTVFRLEELSKLIEQYGYPTGEWRGDDEHRFEVYIEAQIWDDEPLLDYLDS